MIRWFLFCVPRSRGWQWRGKRHGADVRLSTYVYCHCSESRPEEWWGCRWCSPQAFQGGTCTLIRPMTVPCVHARVCVCVCVCVCACMWGLNIHICGTGHVSCRWAHRSPNLFSFQKHGGFATLTYSCTASALWEHLTSKQISTEFRLDW